MNRKSIGIYNYFLKLEENARKNWNRVITFNIMVVLMCGCASATNSPNNYTKEVVQKSNVAQFVNEAKHKQKAQVLFSQGNQLLNAQKYAEAIKLYDQALVIQANFDKVWVNRGNALTGLQKYQDAIASYDQAIKNNPRMDEAWYNRGNALTSLQKYPDAIAAYNQAIKIQPNKHEAWINKGIVLAKLQKYDEAILAYDHAITIQPGKDLVYYNKACAYALQNQPEQAISNLQTAIKLAPGKYEKLAQQDNDFRKIRNHQKFKELIKAAI